MLVFFRLLVTVLKFLVRKRQHLLRIKFQIGNKRVVGNVFYVLLV